MTQRSLSRRWLVSICIALLLGGVLRMPPEPVSAATSRHVTDCGDAGANTLRGQIAAAGAGDTIVFDQDCTITLATGTLTLAQDVTIDGSGHTVIVDGGCTAACGQESAVGGVRVFSVPLGVTAHLNALTIQHGNTANSGGGGILNSGTLVVTNSTISGNTANSTGGGIFNGGTLTVTNSTLSANYATYGGGIDNDVINLVVPVPTLTVTNSTLSGNSAFGGGGLHNAGTFNGSGFNTGKATLTNTIVAGNTAAQDGPDLAASVVSGITSGGHNLFGSTSGATITFGVGDLVNPTPLLDTLGDNGGPTQTIGLLPGSPAIAHGDPAVCANTAGTAPVGGKDQRAAFRPTDLCAIGAFEPLLITISPFSGPIAGGTRVTVTGAGFLTGVTVSLGGVSCANVQVVTDTTLTCLTGAHTAATVDVVLTIGGTTNTLPRAFIYGDTTLHVTDCGDAGSNTLRGRIAAAAGHTIVFDQDCTITLATGTLTLAHNVTIDGSGHTVIVDGGHFWPGISDLNRLGVTVFAVRPGVTANLNALTIQNGYTQGSGGGIANGGALTVTNSMLSDNTADTDGAGIANANGGALAVTNSTLSDNTAGIGDGGGIANANGGALTVTNSTLSGNMASNFTGSRGGGIVNSVGGTATVTNSTISGNRASSQPGFTGSTGGGIANDATLTVMNTIVANNTASTGGPDLSGAITSGGHNLFGSTSGATITPGSGDLVNPTPLLGALGSYGGPTQTIPLLPGSPAIDAGDDATCALTGAAKVSNHDQRGFSRPQGGHCDIGAVEARFTLTVSGGGTQGTPVMQPFAQPLAVTFGGPDAPGALSGVAVTFTANPVAGATATLAPPNPATTDGGGAASVTATANGTGGGYTVTASTPGAASVTFALTNLATTPSYNICLLYDPAKSVKAGAVIPLKVRLCDASGTNYSSASIALHATGLTRIDSTASATVVDAGNANPDSDFRYDATLAGYIFNLKTTGLATGTWALTFTVSGDPTPHTIRFDVR